MVKVYEAKKLMKLLDRTWSREIAHRLEFRAQWTDSDIPDVMT